jgi:hypothetical protein
MTRGVGTGAMTFGTVLAVVGAIMRYAVSVHTDGFSIHTAGVILLVVGIGVIVSACSRWCWVAGARPPRRRAFRTPHRGRFAPRSKTFIARSRPAIERATVSALDPSLRPFGLEADQQRPCARGDRPPPKATCLPR